MRVLVPGEADEANLAGLLGVEQRLHGAALGRRCGRDLPVADDFVKLHQVDVVGLQALERLVDLRRGGLAWLRPSILVIRKTFSR